MSDYDKHHFLHIKTVNAQKTYGREVVYNYEGV